MNRIFSPLGLGTLALLFVSCSQEPPMMTTEARAILDRGAYLEELSQDLAKSKASEGDKIVLPNEDLFKTTKKIAAVIGQEVDEPEDPQAMEDYVVKVPLADDAELSMKPIPGGSFKMGSAAPDAKPDEGPQVEVQLDPFWMGEFEITWDLYKHFMDNTEVGHNQSGGRNKSGTWDLDGERMTHEAPNFATGKPLPTMITQPTPPYVPMNLEMGNGYADGFPAIAMSHYAASKFCAWLSAQTGHFYRLPTEAEWEYACRAGTDTAYSFGDDSAQLEEYGFFVDNAEFNGGSGLEEYSKTGQKKPNAWGLHDMHGNVAEWTLDAYDPDYYKSLGDKAVNPWNKPVNRYPRVVRGGTFEDPAEALRSSARRGSDPSWNMTDPQIPKSIWYLTDGRFVGFRVVRPLKVPTPEEMHVYWNTGPGTPAE